MRTKYKGMTEKEYNELKALSDMEIPTKRLTIATGRSVSTICYIKRSQDYGDYREIVRNANRKKEVEVRPVLAEIETMSLKDKQDITLFMSNINTNMKLMQEDIAWIKDHAEVHVRSKLRI